MNPLFIYIARMVFDNVLANNITFTYNKEVISAWDYIDQQIFNSWIKQPYVSSVIVSILNLLLFLGVAYVLFIKKIFIKI